MAKLPWQQHGSNSAVFIVSGRVMFPMADSARRRFTGVIVWLIAIVIAMTCIDILSSTPALAAGFSGGNGQCPILGMGSLGPCVVTLQRQLDDAKVLPHLAIDGHYGLQTREAVENYQRRMGIPVDGMAGPQTVQALNGPQAKPEAQPSGAATVGASVPDSSAASLNIFQSIWQEMTRYLPPRSLKDVLIDCTPIVIILVIILTFFYLIYRHKDTSEAEFRIFWVLKATPKKRPSNLELRVDLAKEYLRSQNQIAPSDEFFRSIEPGDS
jgi:Putative peptidoglycan binding domain